MKERMLKVEKEHQKEESEEEEQQPVETKRERT